MHEVDQFADVREFIHYKLKDFINEDGTQRESCDVVLYGFGRIGRLLARRIIAQTGRGEQLRLRAIVLRSKMADRYQEVEKRMALLESDSVHGKFQGKITIDPDGNACMINGNRVNIIFANGPADINYKEYGINDAIVIDNTGVWRDEQALSQHLRPGISQVLLTAPGKDIPNIVFGANHLDYEPLDTKISCAASCTTNAIVPVIKAIDQEYGIEKGHVETIHAYTSDQNLLDNFHKKPRRGRGAATNMVLTSTGAASAVSKVIPHLKGKLTGNAVRVPTPNVSLAIMNLNLNKPTSVDQLNEYLTQASLYGDFVEQLDMSISTEYVSSHAVGMTSASVIDGPSTIVSEDGRAATVYAWYDNEFGYTCQVVRLAKYLTGVRRPVYYK